jgi:hypothetical protein
MHLDALHTELQTQAKSIFERAIRTGMLIRPKQCSKCFVIPKRAVEGHHPDYSKPLEVLWLCHRCHRSTHCAVTIAPPIEPVTIREKAAHKAWATRRAKL